MSTMYSVLVVVIVAILLLINSLWLAQSDSTECIDCEILESHISK